MSEVRHQILGSTRRILPTSREFFCLFKDGLSLQGNGIYEK
jgi:hypothetical protein